MCKVCTEAVHCVALWTRTLSHVWACVKYALDRKIRHKGTQLPAVEASCVRAVTACPREQQQQQQQQQQRQHDRNNLNGHIGRYWLPSLPRSSARQSFWFTLVWDCFQVFVKLFSDCVCWACNETCFCTISSTFKRVTWEGGKRCKNKVEQKSVRFFNCAYTHLTPAMSQIMRV